MLFRGLFAGRDGGSRQGRITHVDRRAEKRINTIGKPFPNSTRIVNGELQIRKEWILPRLDDDNVFTNDGWYLTGDLVEQDDEGYIKIIGRSKLTISFGPKNISPIEVEEMVDVMNGVEKSYFTTISFEHDPDVKHPCVCIKRNNDKLFLESDVIDMVNKKLRVCPHIRYVEEFPMTPMKGVNRGVLSELFKNVPY